MFGLKIFVQIQTFQQRPFAPLRNFCHPGDIPYPQQSDVNVYYPSIIISPVLRKYLSTRFSSRVFSSETNLSSDD